MGIRKGGGSNPHAGFPALNGAISKSIKKICWPRELCGCLTLECKATWCYLARWGHHLPWREGKHKQNGVGELGPASQRTVILGITLQKYLRLGN